MATKEKPDLVPDSAALTLPAELEPLPPDGVEVQARGYWEGVWLRLRRDKVAIAGGIFIIFLILGAFIGAPIVKKLLGHGPNDLFPYPGTGGIDENLLPKGPMSYVQDPINGTKELFILGSDGSLGRDEFLRIVYGAQVSIEVAFGATFLSMLLGVIMGSLAGFYGGWTDTLISRVTEITMCFPYLLFVIAVASTVGSRIDNVTFGFLGRGRPHADPRLRLLKLVLRCACVPRDRPVAAREGVRRGGADGRLEQPADRPLARAAAPRRADHRALDAQRRAVRPRRGGPLVPRARDQASDRELGEPARRRAGLLRDRPAPDALARVWR